MFSFVKAVLSTFDLSLKWLQYGYQKTQNMMYVSIPLKKLQKDSCEKNYQRKSDKKTEFLTFITVCKSFRPITFFGWNFLIFLKRTCFTNVSSFTFTPIFWPGRLHCVKKNQNCCTLLAYCTIHLKVFFNQTFYHCFRYKSNYGSAGRSINNERDESWKKPEVESSWHCLRKQCCGSIFKYLNTWKFLTHISLILLYTKSFLACSILKKQLEKNRYEIPDVRHECANISQLYRSSDIFSQKIADLIKQSNSFFVFLLREEEVTCKFCLRYTIESKDTDDSRWYSKYQCYFRTTETLRFRFFACLSIIKTTTNTIMPWLLVLCNGWEHYVPYRCL